jgi:clan AA aspartic protease
VAVILRRPGQRDIEIAFVVDTGFEGTLSLPSAAVVALGLPYYTELDVRLADDSATRTKVYIAPIVWNGVQMDAAVLATGRRPLLGTALLSGKRLEIEFVNAGRVTIDDMPWTTNAQAIPTIDTGALSPRH